MDLTWSNFSLLQDKSEIFLLIILGNCLIVLSEWLEEKLMWSGVLWAVSKGKYFSLARLKITSKKSVSIEFISMAIESPSLHNAMISSLILSSFGSFALLLQPAHGLYKPTLLLSISVLNQLTSKFQQAHKFRLPIISHSNIKQRIISFLYPCGCLIKRERFSWVVDNIINWFALMLIMDLAKEMH